jgi:hypothetical protein
MGRRASVDGVVSSVYSPQFFVIRGTGDLSNFSVPVVSEEPIAAVPGRPSSQSVQVNDTVQVTGDILHFSREAIQSRIDGRFTTHAYDRFLDRPMIVADAVTIDLPRNAQGGVSYRRSRPVPDVTYLITRPKITEMIGQTVRLTRVRVLDVISDRGFWIGAGPDRRIFAVLDKALDSGVMEKIVRIRKGQILNLTGVIEQMPDRNEALHRWTVTPAEADQIVKEPVYFHVNGISLTEP